ncbi:MAG: YegP family protein [Dermatophilaceae bacterium]
MPKMSERPVDDDLNLNYEELGRLLDAGERVQIGAPLSTDDGNVTPIRAPEKIGATSGRFEVYQDKAGKFRFRLKAGNGVIIATGEAYESKAAAKRGIKSLLRATAGATVVELT